MIITWIIPFLRFEVGKQTLLEHRLVSQMLRLAATEAARRYVDDGRERTHVILFTVNSRTFIDAGVGGNDAQYFNHS